MITAVTTEARSEVLARPRADPARVESRSSTASAARKYSHQHGKLIVTPQHKIPAGGALSITVAVRGYAETDPRAVGRGRLGGARPRATLVASQPNGAASWFPCDDHPEFQSAATASRSPPIRPYYAVANGTLVRKQTKCEPDDLGLRADRADGDLSGHHSDRPVRDTDSVGAEAGPHARRSSRRGCAQRSTYDFGRQPQMMEFFTELFGPYPFADYTVVVTDDELEIPLEAQGISIFGANHCDGRRGAERLVAHELAHQWFGNSLTLGQWRDIWLHEGFACYAEWIWSENSGGPIGRPTRDAARIRAWPVSRRTSSIGDPGPAADVRRPGLQARRADSARAARRLGDEKFFELIRQWTPSIGTARSRPSNSPISLHISPTAAAPAVGCLAESTPATSALTRVLSTHAAR